MAASKRLQVYDTPEITVTFDPNVCEHSGACIRGLPAVFDIKRARWVRPELASAEAVAAQVARCPSGALQCRLKGGEGPA
ncbi:MAG TPA: (4Fe-4S)-binding protein [Gemmatimonadales bacterium]|nr:(4Fe-4S)-binding protein [Gemmatimonadales bacterium]